MNKEYYKAMKEKYKDRDNLITRLYLENKTSEEIKEKLTELGYDKISRNRIWNIWKNSEYYRPQKGRTMFCNFCLENKDTIDLFQIREISKYKVIYRICKECLDKLLPEQPINE